MPRWVFCMWVTKLLISPVKIRIFCPKSPNLAQKWHFCSFWARPCRLIWCPVGGLVVMARGLYLARHLFTLSDKYSIAVLQVEEWLGIIYSTQCKRSDRVQFLGWWRGRQLYPAKCQGEPFRCQDESAWNKSGFYGSTAQNWQCKDESAWVKNGFYGSLDSGVKQAASVTLRVRMKSRLTMTITVTTTVTMKAMLRPPRPPWLQRFQPLRQEWRIRMKELQSLNRERPFWLASASVSVLAYCCLIGWKKHRFKFDERNWIDIFHNIPANICHIIYEASARDHPCQRWLFAIPWKHNLWV